MPDDAEAVTGRTTRRAIAAYTRPWRMRLLRVFISHVSANGTPELKGHARSSEVTSQEGPECGSWPVSSGGLVSSKYDWKAIRHGWESGLSYAALTETYGVSRSAVRRHEASENWLRKGESTPTRVAEPVLAGDATPEAAPRSMEPQPEPPPQPPPTPAPRSAQRARLSPRAWILSGVAIGIASLLASLAVVYSNSSGVRDVAEAAAVVQRAESSLSVSTATRSRLGQTVLIAATAEPGTVRGALDDARLALEILDDTVSAFLGVIEDPKTVEDALDQSIRVSSLLLDELSSGEITTAATLSAGPAADAFDNLTAEIASVRDHYAGVIVAADVEAGSVANASRFLVALVIPALATVVVWVSWRRRRRRDMLKSELQHERDLNRSKDQLIANLSHELRTPLTGIYTSALTIDDLGEGDLDLAREINSIIVDQSADLTRMVEDLLVSAQADAGRLTFSCGPVDIGKEIESTVAELERLGAHIGVEVSNGTVHADRGRLRQVLRNLLSNAVRHGGNAISVYGGAHTNTYRIVVEDDGPGVPEPMVSRLFERFIHEGDTPLLEGSVGLGLAITRLLTEGMGGTIAYEHRDGCTRFIVDLVSADAVADDQEGEAA